MAYVKEVACLKSLKIDSSRSRNDKYRCSSLIQRMSGKQTGAQKGIQMGIQMEKSYKMTVT
eukprot:scaffold583_cov176-Amphora_coffeaeformis.AAC.4